MTIKPIPPSAETMAIVNAATSNIARAGGNRTSNIRVQLPTTPIPQQQSGVVVKAMKAEGGQGQQQVGPPPSVVVVAHPGGVAGPPGSVVRLPMRPAPHGAPIIVGPSPARPVGVPTSVAPGGGILLPVLPTTPLQREAVTQDNKVTVLAPAGAAGGRPQPVLVRKIPSPAAAALHPRLGTPLPPQLPQEPVPISQATASFQRPLPRPPQGQSPKVAVAAMGTPLPDNLCLPSEPVPLDSQEMQLKLQQQSPKMTIKPEVSFQRFLYYIHKIDEDTKLIQIIETYYYVP